MLNPIKEKLQKLFNHNKKSKLKTEASTPFSAFSGSFLHSVDKENDSRYLNHANSSANGPFMSFTLRREETKSAAKVDDVQKVFQDNEKLKEKIKTHEQMEEFYLKQLELQRKQKSNLEWRLSILNEEIQNSTQIKKKKCMKENLILRDRVQIARKGLDHTQQNLS